ncbi:MAG: NAD(P)H-hydrate dehydratase [Dysgonamonadaceae bacterium]|jgi:NAD(P)H-hydrate epimerase|nr:NAD(P)H-hydrate dehydratase [Dysgonamonadaceae bacterium]
MKIFNTGQIKELDQYTIQNEPIGSHQLMIRAASCFFDRFCSEITPDSRIFIFAGFGNNGGDALSIAHFLNSAGYHAVHTYLFNTENKLSPDCEIQKKALDASLNILFTEITDKFSLPSLNKEDIIIDGLFGAGLNRPLSGGFASVVKFINKSKAKVYAIDIPSGLFGEDNSENNQDTIVKAYKTFTFQAPKLSFFLPENAGYTGDWEILNIGLHPDALQKIPTPYYYTEKDDIAKILRTRPKFAHKGNFGHSLLIAGSKGKMGAAILSAKACLKSGSGLLTCHIPGCGYAIMQTAFPEAMVSTDTMNDCIERIPDNPGQFDAIGVGPGIGRSQETLSMLTTLFSCYRKPVVVDADALNLIAGNESLKKTIPPKSILTPHPKEFDRIAGTSGSSYERLQKARELARESDCYIILKGAYSAVITPETGCWLNPTGNPGMATAGSGDVLTGILTGLLAQGYTPFESCRLGVYLHGLAGDLCLESESYESLIAGDLIDHIGAAFKNI